MAIGKHRDEKLPFTQHLKSSVYKFVRICINYTKLGLEGRVVSTTERRNDTGIEREGMTLNLSERYLRSAPPS